MIKKIDKESYFILCSWWKKHGLETAPPIEFLEDKGYFSFVNDVPAFFGTLYCAPPIGFITFMTSNPVSSWEDKETAFNKLTAHLESLAKSNGVIALIAESNNKNLCDRFINFGFDKKDENITHLLKGI